MKQRLARAQVLVVMLAWATSARADAVVTFNFQTSRGSVDRATIQSAFGLNNGQMQKNAEEVVFSSLERTTITVICNTGPARVALAEISGTVNFTLVPTRGPFDGFALAGLRDVLVSDPGPAELICGGPGSFGGQTVLRRLSASLGAQSIVLLEQH